MRAVAAVVVLTGRLAAADPPHAVATRREGSITIDGRLEDPAWRHAQVQRGFIQRVPAYGGKADEDTRFAIVYDDHAVYVAVWADDRAPENIRPALTRRDVETPSDTIAVCLDSRDDHRTAYCFTLSSAGVQRDVLGYDDSQIDVGWDAVWRSEVAIGATGWTAELEIPFTQLRYATASQSWGLQVLRTVGRTGEESGWAPWPRETDRFVSNFGRLDGIRGPALRRLELLPYATAGIERDRKTTTIGNLGFDAKWGIGSAFTLAATINPDFGQVEADPSEINLHAGELFFAEKRPFFLEGVELFQLLIGASDHNVEGPFYSRRIGAAPANDDGEVLANAPAETTIYGAAKLTGKTASGWSIGILDAVTGRETAPDDAGTERTIAPLTNYAIGRLKRDFRAGRTSVGVIATAVERDLDPDTAPLVRDRALAGAAQLNHRWDDYMLDLQWLGSTVHGSASAIERLQRDPRHYFQRPDRNTLLDPTKTRLDGLGFTWLVGKVDSGTFRYGLGGDYRSAGLELNDVGFMREANRVIPFVYAEYHHLEPTDHTLSWSLSPSVYGIDHFGDVDHVEQVGFQLGWNVQLLNFWMFSGSVEYSVDRWEPAALRGGPSLRFVDRIPASFHAETDGRKEVRGELDFAIERYPALDSTTASLTFGLVARASSQLELFAGPTWSSTDLATQYVAETVDTAGAPHYILARIRQTTATMTLRIDWALTRRLSLQAYAQPLIASGRYSQYKDVVDPRAKAVDDRFRLIDPELTLGDGRLMSSRGFSFDKPDFDVRELRSIIVARWEYRPGSTIFAIWSHNRGSFEPDGRFRPGHDLDALFSAPADNLVMVKANYWFGL